MQNTFFYKNHKFFVTFLKKQGWTGNSNICDYWFANKNILLNRFYQKYPIYGSNTRYLDEIETQIRWESKLGQLFVNAIKEYLNIEQTELRKLSTKKNPFNGFGKEIDISKVSVNYKDKLIFIVQFCELFNTNSTIGGQIDLRGIPLKGFRIDNITLSNLCFDYSEFSSSHIQQCTLYNVNFANCDFKNSHISGVTINKETHFSGCDFSNSYICIFPNKNDSHHKNIGKFKFNKISYFQLLKLTILKLVFNYRKNIKLKYTSFSFDDVSFYSKNPETIKYLFWFQKVQERIFGKSEYSFRANLKFFLEILITKYWSSFFSLIFFSILVILIFAIPYSNLIIEKRNLITYFDAVYHSVTCFTRLGASNYPLNTTLLKSLSLTESILGYIVLAVLIYLLSEKLNNKY